METASDSIWIRETLGACKAEAIPLETPCQPIDDAEILRVAQAMNLGGLGAGGGAALLTALLADTDVPSLIQRINSQPGIAVRVLRVANSAYYGRSGSVASVEQAAALLGSIALRGIAAAACFDRMTVASTRGTSPDLPAMRLHSVAVACAAQALARQTEPQVAGLAFMAGLLHDMGLLVQWKLRPNGLKRVKVALSDSSHVARFAASSDQFESHHFGATHAHCGQLLLRAWHLPPALVAAVAAHDAHDVEDGVRITGAGLPPRLLWVADRLACDAGFGFDHETSGPIPAAHESPPCGLTEAQCATTLQALPDMVESLSEALRE